SECSSRSSVSPPQLPAPCAVKAVVIAKDAEVAQEELSVSSFLEVSNLPDLSGKSSSPGKYLAGMFNPTLTILPDFNKDLGTEPVERAWSQGDNTVIMKMQNSALVESAVRILTGLELFGNELKVRAIPTSE
ncbi:unnamed protein product, partial [Polarella glacialis]